MSSISRNIHFNNIFLSIDTRDNCCILYDGSICIVTEIAIDNNIYRLTVKKFLNVSDFYDVGMVSSCFQFYKCATLNSDRFYVSLNQIRAKCYRMPFWDCLSMNDSDSDEDDHLEMQYIVAVIIHSEKM